MPSILLCCTDWHPEQNAIRPTLPHELARKPLYALRTLVLTVLSHSHYTAVLLFLLTLLCSRSRRTVGHSASCCEVVVLQHICWAVQVAGEVYANSARSTPASSALNTPWDTPDMRSVHRCPTASLVTPQYSQAFDRRCRYRHCRLWARQSLGAII